MLAKYLAARNKRNRRRKRFTVASIADTMNKVQLTVLKQLRHQQFTSLLNEERIAEITRALMEKEEETRLAERKQRLHTLEMNSLGYMQKARVHLRRLLLTRRDGT
jgi:hypothetical protein